MSSINKITDALGFRKRGSTITENANQVASTQLEILLSTARRHAAQAPQTRESELILELCAVIEAAPSDPAELRREIFRDAVKGIANVIRNSQLPVDLPLSKMVPGAYGTPELLAAEIERANATEPVLLGELRQIRQKLKSATEGNDDIDDSIRRLYYASVFAKNPSTEDILPPGSPSRSLDLAALVVQKVLPNGWWTLGASGHNLDDMPVAKVGTWTGDSPKPESAPTTPLTLLLALMLTLIEAEKKSG
ncbi:hypothetical protein [Neorhizobium alkalisoli]|uniref:Uncharacterized protein n=1 Tax=Neorhizobium alkalisoli TaxID=528178 RepID=A0A561R3E1_9HYPH|nr:hypothetical protein [Neorhizobium alkalisoli]TWF57146.1 hypothetical protein FHW37_102787 [Neorhizobium alkalisoli]